MKHITLLLLFLGAFSLHSQKAIVVSGGDISDTNSSVSYTVGQLAYGFYSANNGLFIQGVQQPFEIFTQQVLDVPNLPEISLSFSVYPNPTTNLVNLSISNIEGLDLKYYLYDIQSREIARDFIITKDSNIPMFNYPSGTYFLKVVDTQNTLKTFKIIKN